MNKIIELARKLKALAEQGVGGEKQNAQDALYRFMSKHNITLDEVNGVEKKKEPFSYKDAFHKKFILQVVASVAGRNTKLYVVSNSRKKRFFIELTKAEYIEISAKVDFFWRLYQKEQESFYTAFIQVNKLYAKPEGDKKEESKELTPEEREELRRVLEMMQAIKPGQFHKQLT